MASSNIVSIVILALVVPSLGCTSGLQKQLATADAKVSTLSTLLEEEHNQYLGAENRIKVWSKSFDAATLELRETHAQAGMYELSLEILRQNYTCKPNKGYTPSADDVEDFPLPVKK